MDRPRCSVYFIKRNKSKESIIGRNKNLICGYTPNKIMSKNKKFNKNSVKYSNCNASGSSFTNTILRDHISHTVDPNNKEDNEEYELRTQQNNTTSKNAIDIIKHIHNVIKFNFLALHFFVFLYFINSHNWKFEFVKKWSFPQYLIVTKAKYNFLSLFLDSSLIKEWHQIILIFNGIKHLLLIACFAFFRKLINLKFIVEKLW